MRTLSALFLGAFFLLFAGASDSEAAACSTIPNNLVTNCGFETVVGGTGSFTGWALSGNDVPTQLNNLYGVEGTDPADGITPHGGSYQAFFADNTGNATTLSQTIATTAGMAYEITFWAAQDTATQAGYPNELGVKFGGTTIYSSTNIPVEGYTEYVLYGTATAASTSLSFTLGDDLGEILLDDISVTSAPEPTTVGLFLSGGLLLGSLVRRKRAI